MVKLQAHRGVSSDYPENTMIAYEAAIKQGYALIELDPKYTIDNKFVMLHDASLKRTARDQYGNSPDLLIKDITLAEAKRYEYGSWKGEKFKGEQIPTLSDVLDLSEKNPHISIKIDNIWGKFPENLQISFLNEIKARGNNVNIGLTCATLETLSLAAKELPYATLHYDGMDLEETTLKSISDIAKGHNFIIWICYDNLQTAWFKGTKASLNLCNKVRKYGKIGIWLISKPEELEKAINDFRADYIETNGIIKPSCISK